MLTGIEGFRTFNLGERNSVFEITVQMTDKSDGIPKGLNVGLYPYYSINVMGFQFGLIIFKRKITLLAALNLSMKLSDTWLL